MSNLIPPLLSSSPPPIVGPLDEDDDDEFGDFRAAADSYDCDDFSLPPSPQKSPEKELKTDISRVNLDINCNKSQKISSTTEMPTQNLNGSILNEEVKKDFQDRRKSLDVKVDDDPNPHEFEVNFSNSQSESPPKFFDNNKDVNSLQNDEQTEDKPTELNVSEQDSKIKDDSTAVEDVFDFESVVPISKNACDENQQNEVASVELKSSEVDNENENNLNNKENEESLFDAFSDCVQEKTSNSDDLSDMNEHSEIKSENDGIEEINFEITSKDEGESKVDDSSKEENYDNLSESSVSLKVCETDPKLSEDEFGDFENHFATEVDDIHKTSEDEFDDFVDPCPPMQDVEERIDDDFGDFESSEFADFSSQACEKPTFLEIDEKNAVDKSETILKDIFPSVDSEMKEFEFADETKGITVFDELKDVTETNALIYQWSKSNSQKMFFKALNIDTRNILYGPAWNCSMPRFAANLGLTPLEPVKTEILTPTPIQNVSSPSNSSQKNNSDIPTAQFDWSGSGLINPLDSTSAELPGNVPEESSQPQIQNDFLPTTTDKPEPIPSLFDTESLEKIAAEPSVSQNENNTDLPKTTTDDQFSQFQSPKLIPLRETHISTELNDVNGKPGWLQPTILTPDLPRKDTVIDPLDEDEFDDFQMVLPEENKEKPSAPELKSTLALPDLSEFDMTSKVATPVDISKNSQNHEHIFGVPLNNVVEEKKIDVNDDDEFTEFHSSLPQNNILKPLQPVPMEPLKPTVQYSQPTQINWPDPGVTDEDIRNIELSYFRKNEVKEEKAKEVSKDNSLDDEEWSDFVSVTNPVKSVLPERTATPDLPLSVLNLNNVQAPKQPIPVITPSGLVQTKLSSNMTLQPKSVVQTSVQPSMFRPPTTQFQPSIISNQFAANFASGNSTTMAPPTKSQSQDDDDDWSDFVSSQPPPPSQMNGYQQKTSFSQGKAPQINWTNATTNIIMNPTHFETFQSYAPPQNKKVSPMSARNVIPSISAIPDLDFIAPKNRTSKK
ncbi:aftiphilin isoform X2 [Zophobas morio]|uniref:aftiphilin isoform X2 n=1 Tax=Zophobas morio TaxID=2755281 RepID=UPI003083431D